MNRKKGRSSPEEKPKQNSLLGWLMTREEPDQEFVPELQSQWARLDIAGRIKFVFGALIGAVLFFGALYVVYLLLSAMAG